MEGLAGANGLAVARRLAEAAHKLHVVDVPARREHTVADELRILHERLDALAAQRPDLGGVHRLGRLLAACDRLAATIPAPELSATWAVSVSASAATITGRPTESTP